MTNFTLTAVDSTNRPIVGAKVDLVFRGDFLSVGFNTGTATGVTNASGQYTHVIPFKTNHVNWTATYGAYTKSGQTSVVGKDILIPITVGTSGTLVYNPAQVVGNTISDDVVNATNWFINHLIDIIVIITVVLVGYWLIKRFYQPLISTAKHVEHKVEQAAKSILY